MNRLEFSLAAVAAGVCAWALVAIWIRVSLRARIVDVPNQRSSHQKTTPRGGGVGIVATVLVGILVVLGAERIGDRSGALWLCGLAFFIAVMSFVDDVRSLPSLLRLFFQIGMAVAAVAVLGAFPAVTVPFFEPIVLPEWFMWVLTCIWIIGLTNVYNFMDGIDGIAGGQGLVAGLAWSWFGVVTGVPLVTWTGSFVAAACLGFLVHNWSPAKVFMGDVGSAFLGFVFAVLPLLALRGRAVDVEWPTTLVGAIPVFAAMVVWPFIGDGIFTFFRRLKHKENVLAAHRSHLYQRLTISGWPHAPVARLYVWWAALSAIGGGYYLRAGHIGRAMVVSVCLLALLAMYLLVKRVERGRREARL